MGLDAKETVRIADLFTRAGLPTQVRLSDAQFHRLIETMRVDKKVSGGQVKFVLAKRIGEVVWGQKVPVEAIAEALNHRGKGRYGRGK
jgi:3-dehydroquinate synthetase